MKNQPLAVFVLLIALAAAVYFTWPKTNGWEISSWLGKFTVKPAPAAPVVVAPATRCLIFTAAWCKPCSQLKRNVAGMGRAGWRVGPLETDDIELLDVDGRDERIAKYNPRSLPTLIIVDKSGKELARREGVQTADELGAWIRSTRPPTAAAL